MDKMKIAERILEVEMHLRLKSRDVEEGEVVRTLYSIQVLRVLSTCIHRSFFVTVNFEKYFSIARYDLH